MPRAARARAGNGGTSRGRFSAKPSTGQCVASAGMPPSGGCVFSPLTVPSLDASAARITLPASFTASTKA